MPVLAELALWGYHWAWSQPRSGERIDMGAILRLVPGLVHGQRAARRDRVHDHRRAPRRRPADAHRHARGATQADVMEQPADHADARISGDTRAWVSAFSPGGSTGSLQISGDRELAEHLLGQLARAGDAGDGGDGPGSGLSGGGCNGTT